ncbi:hypothetical protein [Faecalimicrobium sp. JNUCC 81]
MNMGRSGTWILLIVLMSMFFLFGFFIMKDNKEVVKNDKPNANIESNHSKEENKDEVNTFSLEENKDKKEVEVIKDFAQDKSLSEEDNNTIKNTVESFLRAYCSINEDINPKKRLEAVKGLIKSSLYEELNKQIDVETALATEYYVYRNLNKIAIHSVQNKDNKVLVDTIVFSDWVNSDLSTQIEDAPQDYILTLVKEDDNWVIDSFTERFK